MFKLDIRVGVKIFGHFLIFKKLDFSNLNYKFLTEHSMEFLLSEIFLYLYVKFCILKLNSMKIKHHQKINCLYLNFKSTNCYRSFL